MGDWWQTGGMVDVWANGVSIPRLNGLPVDLTGFSFSLMLVTFFFPSPIQSCRNFLESINKMTGIKSITGINVIYLLTILIKQSKESYNL